MGWRSQSLATATQTLRAEMLVATGSLLELGWGEDPGAGPAPGHGQFRGSNSIEVRSAEGERNSESGSRERKDAGMQKRVWRAGGRNGQASLELGGGKYHQNLKNV